MAVKILIALSGVGFTLLVVEQAEDILQFPLRNRSKQLKLLDFAYFKVDFIPLIVREHSLKVVFCKDCRNKTFRCDNTGGVSGLD